MDDKVRERIRMLYALVERGTDGERESAKRTLNALLKKYNLENLNIDDIDKPVRKFKYTSTIELQLLATIIDYFLSKEVTKTGKRYLNKEKAVGLPLNHIDYITIECAYEYFRRHMRQQWKLLCEPVLRKCRKVKTRNKRRVELQNIFIQRYIIASKLIREEDLITRDLSDISAKEMNDLLILGKVEGGKYNVQVHGGNALPEPKQPVKTKGTQLQLL